MKFKTALQYRVIYQVRSLAFILAFMLCSAFFFLLLACSFLTT